MAAVDIASEGMREPVSAREFGAALLRARTGGATQEDRGRFTLAADHLNSFYDDLIVPPSDETMHFDRTKLHEALQASGASPRELADTLGDILGRMGEGYDPEPEEHELVLRFFLQYQELITESSARRAVTGG